MIKYILFVLDKFDKNNFKGHPVINIDEIIGYNDYYNTECAIQRGEEHIMTHSIAHLSFDLITLGYQIFVSYKDRIIEMKPGMNNASDKDIRFAHNIRKMLIAGFFNEDLGVEYPDFQKN